MVDSQVGTYSNTNGASMSSSPTVDRNLNAPRVGDSLESLGLGGDEACVTTSMAMSQGGNLHNNTVEPMSGSSMASSKHDAPRVGGSLESLGLGREEACFVGSYQRAFYNRKDISA